MCMLVHCSISLQCSFSSAPACYVRCAHCKHLKGREQLPPKRQITKQRLTAMHADVLRGL